MRFELNRCVIGDCREVLQTLPDNTFHCCITSPPYWNLRDSYASKPGVGLKPKDLVAIPWTLAIALRADGWWLRSEIIWAKPRVMPESITDRPTKAHEQVFLLAKSPKYFYDAKAIAEKASNAGQVNDYTGDQKANTTDPVRQATHLRGREILVAETRNARTVWTIVSEQYAGAHFAAMPRALVKRCMLAGCPEGGAVLDPFFGSGTVGEVAELLGRQWYGCELNPEYGTLIAKRTAQTGLQFGEPGL